MNNPEKPFLLKEYRGIFKVVPLKKLRKHEKSLVKRCLNGEQNFTDEELEILRRVAVKYQSAKDIEAEEILDNVDAVIKTIKTEKDLINLLNKEEKGQELLVNLPIYDETYQICFEVLPIRDSSKLQEMEAHAQLFSDFSLKDRNIFQKGENNPEQLTDEEKEVYQTLLEKINDKAFTNSEELIMSVLCNQLKIKDIPFNYEQNKALWEKVQINIKTAVFLRVQDMLGLGDFDLKDLFPTLE